MAGDSRHITADVWLTKRNLIVEWPRYTESPTGEPARRRLFHTKLAVGPYLGLHGSGHPTHLTPLKRSIQREFSRRAWRRRRAGRLLEGQSIQTRPSKTNQERSDASLHVRRRPASLASRDPNGCFSAALMAASEKIDRLSWVHLRIRHPPLSGSSCQSSGCPITDSISSIRPQFLERFKIIFVTTRPQSYP
jgi:hypothetical protein